MGIHKRTKRYLKRLRRYQKKHGFVTRKAVVRLFPKRFKSCYQNGTLKRSWNRAAPGLDRGRLTIPKTMVHLHFCTEGSAQVHHKSYDYMNSVSLDNHYTMAIQGGNQYAHDELQHRGLTEEQTNVYTNPDGRHVILISNGNREGSSKKYQMVTTHKGKVCNEDSMNETMSVVFRCPFEAAVQAGMTVRQRRGGKKSYLQVNETSWAHPDARYRDEKGRIVTIVRQLARFCRCFLEEKTKRSLGDVTTEQGMKQLVDDALWAHWERKKPMYTMKLYRKRMKDQQEFRARMMIMVSERIKRSHCDVDVMVQASRVQRDVCLSKGLTDALRAASRAKEKG